MLVASNFLDIGDETKVDVAVRWVRAEGDTLIELLRAFTIE